MARSKRLSRTSQTVDLSPDQEALAEAIYSKIRASMEVDLMDMARLMASQPDEELLGLGEFALRDRLNKVGAKVLETAVNERAKKGIPR